MSKPNTDTSGLPLSKTLFIRSSAMSPSGRLRRKLPPREELARREHNTWEEQRKAAARRESHKALFERGTNAEVVRRQDYPPKRWLVDGLMPRGSFALFSGAPKAGKTWACLQLACDVAHAMPFLGCKEYPTSRGSVLLLSLQISDEQIADRLKKLGVGEESLASLDIFHEWPRGEEARECIREWKQTHGACSLVVIDMMQQVSVIEGSREHSYAANTTEIAAWTELAQELGIAILGTTHNRKSSTNAFIPTDFLEEQIGSIGKTGSASVVWTIKRGRGQPKGTLSVTGWDIADAEIPMELHIPGGWKILEGEATEAKVSAERQEILDALRILAPGACASPTDIAEATGRSAGAVKMMLASLRKEDLVKRVTRGRYKIVGNDPPGESPSLPPDLLTLEKGKEVRKSVSKKVSKYLKQA